MLIECSECKKQISDKANNCPNCGCPIDKMEMGNYCNINGRAYNLSDIITILPKVGNKDTDVHPYYIIGMLRDRTPLNPQSANELANIILETKVIPEEFNGDIEIKNESSNIPKCPTCGSTNIEKISLTKKAFGGAMFGLFSSDVRNTMKCKNCGAKW